MPISSSVRESKHLQCRVRAGGKLIKAITKGCHMVNASLKSKTLLAEVKILHSILYINHNPLGYHKPYLALKQVQQCEKRLTRMNLQGSIQDFVELCPTKKDLANTESCSVPSQPLIELVSVKILGSCKLFLRLLDCCCKAFHLTVQHLHLEEYIVLNVVVLGLLSRLWVLYRGILKNLSSLYGAIYGLLKDVSSVQQMPYIKGFTFPLSIREFLDPAFSEIVKQKLAPKKTLRKGVTGLLNKLFPAGGLTSKLGSATALAFPKKVTQIKGPVKQLFDIGKPIQKRRNRTEKFPEFDIKTLRQRLHQNVTMDATSTLNSPDFKNCRGRSVAVSSPKELRTDCATCFVPKIQGVQSFKELSEELKHVVKWCRSRKLKSNLLFLGNKRLKSNRLHHLEALGYSLKKKLKCVKASVCRYLLHGSRNTGPHRLPLRKLSCANVRQNGRITLQKKYRLKVSQDIKIATQQTLKHIHEHTQQDDKSISHSPTQTLQTYDSAQVVRKAADKPCEVATNETMKSIRKTVIKGSMIKDDIDEIFEAMGV